VEHNVDVRVDQAWHQRPPVKVAARGGAGGDRTIGDLLDQTVLDQHGNAVLEFILARIEEAPPAEQIDGHAV
jgi:hypothetical protein